MSTNWRRQSLKVFGVQIDAAEGLFVKDRVLPAVVDPGVVLHAHDVGGLVAGQREAGEGEESKQQQKFALVLGYWDSDAETKKCSRLMLSHLCFSFNSNSFAKFDFFPILHGIKVYLLISVWKNALVNRRDQLPSCHCVRGQFLGARTLEPNHPLGLLLAVGDLVGIVAHVDLGRVGQSFVAGRLIGYPSSALKRLECRYYICGS